MRFSFQTLQQSARYGVPELHRSITLFLTLVFHAGDACCGDHVYFWYPFFQGVGLVSLAKDFPRPPLPSGSLGNWAIGSFVLAYSLDQTFSIIFECTQVKKFWDQSVKGRCINENDVYLVCSSLNIATDVIILAMPMPKLWKLQISRTEKIQLSIIFGLGAS